MLTQEQIALVKATVPVLREHGVALTSHFYKRMLSHNPELMQVFNQGHQRVGAQQQALAGAVLAYAENIENLGVLLNAVKHIANKHVSVFAQNIIQSLENIFWHLLEKSSVRLQLRN